QADLDGEIILLAPYLEEQVDGQQPRGHYQDNHGKWQRERHVLHGAHCRRIFSIALPFASSSTSLSKYRIFFISGFSTSSTRTPHTRPVIFDLLRFISGASAKKVLRSTSFLICFCSPALV